MTFTQIPENFSSSLTPLIYRIESDEVEDITIEIKCNFVTIGKKLFLNTSQAEIDIAPILRSQIKPSPDLLNSGLYINSQTDLFVVVSANSISSASRIFTLSRRDNDSELHRSTMPLIRTISRGEHDEITLKSGALNATVEVVTPNESSTTTLYGGNPSRSLTLHLNTSSMNIDTTAININVNFSGGERMEIHYDIVPRGERGVRLIWLSSKGCFEHYTFPHLSHLKQASTCNSIELKSGEFYPKTTSSISTIRVLSELEPRALQDAISEIIQSPAIWIESSSCGLIPAKIKERELKCFDSDSPLPIELLLEVKTENLAKIWS